MPVIKHYDKKVMRDSLITSIQFAYDSYKNRLRNYLDKTWVGSDGQFCIIENAKTDMAKAEEWLKEYKRLSKELERMDSENANNNT